MPYHSKIYTIITILVLMVVGLYFIFSRNGSSEIVRGYHQSQFFKYAEFIENSLAEVQDNSEIDLTEIKGGIVSHHIPTAIPMLAEFYTKLKNTRPVETFVILGPDHLDLGRGEVNVSKASFVTPFGTLESNLEIIEQLEKSGFVTLDEAPFDKEHSVDSQLLFISKLFPEAKIVPLVFRSSFSNEAAKSFGNVLASIIDEGTFVVASVDFSHYLSEKQARPIDYLSANVLGVIDSQLAELAEADSTQALVALMAYLETKGANQLVDLRVFNTNDFNNNSDYTTGYVTGFWGMK